MSYLPDLSKFTALIFVGLLPLSANSQANNTEVPTYTTFSSNMIIDTVIEPDKFEVRISITEYSSYGKIKRPHFIGRRWDYRIIPIDSVERKFYMAIEDVGIARVPAIVNTSMINNSNRKLRTYVLYFNSLDSVRFLYSHLLKVLRTSEFSSYQPFPIVTSARTDSIKSTMIKHATKKIKSEAEIFAKGNSMKLVQLAGFNANFNTINAYAYTSANLIDYSGSNPNFINLNYNVTCQMNVYYTYYLLPLEGALSVE